MSKIEQVIVGVLGLFCLVAIGFIIRAWTQQESVVATDAAANAVSQQALVGEKQPEQTRPNYYREAKEAITNRMRDPESVRFGRIYSGSGRSGMQVVCGEVNAKNGFGGYTGMTPFVYFVGEDLATTVETSPTSRDVRYLELNLRALKTYAAECAS